MKCCALARLVICPAHGVANAGLYCKFASVN
jgi:hypothetical protein